MNSCVEGRGVVLVRRARKQRAEDLPELRSTKVASMPRHNLSQSDDLSFAPDSFGEVLTKFPSRRLRTINATLILSLFTIARLVDAGGYCVGNSYKSIDSRFAWF